MRDAQPVRGRHADRRPRPTCHLWRGRHNSTVWQTDLLIADGVLWLHNVRVNPNEKYVHGYDWTNAQARRTLSLAHHSNTMRAAHLNLCSV